MSYQGDKDGLGVMHEHVEIDLGPDHLSRLDTIVDPVIVSEIPTLLWSPHGHEAAVRSLRHMVDVMLLDSDDSAEPAEALARAAEHLEAAYVVDLAWLRTTPWRERLASSFDARRRPALGRICALTVRHREGSSASALLLTAWLASRLGWEVQRLSAADQGGLSGSARAGEGDISLRLEVVDQDAPGLAGVTVAWGSDCQLSLDRSAGGLCAREQVEGTEREWKVVGASRGEGGILGEGVRQALLRDPTYGPALELARDLCPA
jgi:glucose-6-phosphate dehydrogenase assembly protein OpcA